MARSPSFAHIFAPFFSISATGNKSGTYLRCHKRPNGRTLTFNQLATSAIKDIWCLVVCFVLVKTMTVSFLSSPPPQARSQKEVRLTIIPASFKEETPPNKPKVAPQNSRFKWKQVTSVSCPLYLLLPWLRRRVQTVKDGTSAACTTFSRFVLLF